MQPSSSDPVEGDLCTMHALFNALPGHAVLVKADAPRFTILAATPGYLSQTGRTLQSMVGKGVFEAFPGNSDDANTGPGMLRLSYEEVVKKKVPYFLPIQRYDLQNEDGSFSERYWRVSNSPVFGQNGDVLYVIHTAEDITHEIKAREQEQKMKGMEQAHRLFMQVPFAIHIFSGKDLVIELANPPTLELWGKTASVIGKRFLDVLPELKGQGYDEMMHQVMQTGTPRFFYEVPLKLNRQGKDPVGYFNFIYQPYYKAAGVKADSVLITAHEVTQQVLARKQASYSEQSLSLAVEIAKLGVFDIDLATGMATYSQQVMDWFGFDQPSSPVSEVIAHIHAGDQALTNEMLQRSVAGEWEGRHNFVYRVLHPKTGSIRYLRSIGQVLFEEGKAVRLSGIIQDETEQMLLQKSIEESQQDLLALFEEAPVAIATIAAGEELVLQSANAFYLQLVGRTKEAVGKPLLQVLPELKGQGFDSLLRGVMLTGVPFRALEAPATIQRNGKKETIYVNLSFQPRQNAGGQNTGVLLVASDVTQQVLVRHKIEELVAQRTKELAEANQSLKATNAELQRSNANLEEFAHAASHDLKEPIRKIHFFTSRLKGQLGEQLNSGELHAFLRIENATERMGNLIDDLLLYSHVSQRPHQKEAVDLNAKVQRVLEDLELDIQEKNAVVKVGRLPVVQGYKRQLQQLLQNLISNALKYSKAGLQPEITITAETKEREDKLYHTIVVEDNGIGFEPEYSEKIFQMFARLHGKSEYSGTGVGLSIVKKVVDNHHGAIEVESRPGEGSVFKVLLPAD